MRVAVVIPSVSRVGAGVAEAARQVVLGLRRSNMDIHLYTLSDSYLSEDRINWGALEISSHSVLGPPRYGLSPGLLMSLLTAKIDIIHVHGLWMFQCLAVLIASIIRGIPYIVTPHGMLEPWILGRSQVLKALITNLYQRKFIARASLVHALTEKERADILSYSPGSRAEVVPNFVTSSEEPPDLDHVAEEPSLQGRCVFLYFGRIHEKKGCMELCGAWEQACGENDWFAANAGLIFCGPIDGLDEFRSALDETKKKFNNIIYLEGRYGADKEALIRSAKFLVLPSKSEGLPTVILEAWHAGVPTLMTRHCNLPMGFECNAAIEMGTDSDSISQTLQHAAEIDVNKYAEMTIMAKGIIEERFSPDAVITRTIEMYHSVHKKPQVN